MIQESDELSEDSDNSVTNENAKRTRIKTNKQQRKKKKNDLFKPPTNEEMNRLRETENLFNSSLFRMQIEEMINEISIKQKRVTEFESWMTGFDAFMQNLSEYNDMQISDIKKIEKQSKKSKFINKLLESKFDYIEADQDMTVKFIKPETYNTFGFFRNQCSLKNFMDFNINIIMPKAMFNVKDYLNNRYLVKRYYYMLYIACELRKSKLCSNISFGYMHGNELLPIILIQPKNFEKIEKITIVLTPPEEYFKMARFTPNKNNVKADVFENVSIDKSVESGTALYNSTLLHDISLKKNNDEIQSKLLDMKNMQDAVKLLVVWLTQRNLNNGLVSFQNHIIIYVLMYLLVKRKINKPMSSYQVVRIFWNFIATTDWTESPISITEIQQDTNNLELYKNNYTTSVLDFTGFYNVTSFLNKDIYLKVKSEATLALKFLDKSEMNAFDALFMIKMPISTQHDAILSIQDDNNFASIRKLCSDDEKFKYMGFQKELIVAKISKYLKKGMNKRCKHIVPYYRTKDIVWHCGHEKQDDFDKIIIGLTLNPEFAFSPLEMGPPEYDPKAEEFRTFWGDLCELRRFADNKICEAVYMKCGTIQERRQVFKRMLDYILKEKLDLKYKLNANEYETVVKMSNVVAPFPVGGTNEEIYLLIKNSFDKLREKLRAIKIQLGVMSVQGSSAVFSHTDPFPPLPTNYKCGKKVTTTVGDVITLRTDINLGIVPRYTAPVECVFQLARDSKWPNELDALRAVVTEFYFEISNLLKEDNVVTKVKHDHLDVLFEGLVFRLRLYQPKEVMLLKKTINEEGLTAYKDNSESLELEKKFNIIPSLTGALNGLMLQCPAYGPSTCIIKRWLRSQLIDDYHFPDVAVDLLNASLFVESAPYEPAHLPQVAFMRFLKFMAEFDFENQPVIINFNDKLTGDDLNNLQSDFQQNRTKYPCLYIATPYDEMKSVFTTNSPTQAILKRITILAKETFNFTDNCITGPGSLHIMDLFVPNLQGYNVIIHLNLLMISKRYQSIEINNMPIEYEAFNEKKNSNIPICDFDPVHRYLTELRDAYDDFALFFYNTFGGSCIGVLWKPNTQKEKEFKVLQTSCQKLVKDKLIFNQDAVIEDFYILGSGLVKNIEVRQ